MKQHFLCMLISLVTSSFLFAQTNKKFPVELKPFVFKGYELLDFAEGDLNADTKKDAILILKKEGEDSIMADELARPFLLLLRQPDGKLFLTKRNDSLVMCRNCGGIWGDPYEGLEIKKNSFIISFYGGSSWRWGYNYTFTYNATAKDWFLTREQQISYHNTEAELDLNPCIIEADELGIVPLDKFNYDPAYTETQWKVTAAKAFFYDSPQLGGKHRKGYLMKGDIAVGSRILKNFVEVSFQGNNDNYTSGYMLKSALQQVK